MLLITNYPQYTRPINKPTVPLSVFVQIEAEAKALEVPSGGTAVAIVTDDDGQELARAEVPSLVYE